jgi:hypothetical protein
VHDPVEHRYWLGERELVGASRLLRLCGLVDDSFYLSEHSERGRIVHEATVLIDCQQFGDCDPRLRGYLTAYQKFLDEQRPTYADNGEHMTCSAFHGFAGTIDRLVTRMQRRKRKLLIDFLTQSARSTAKKAPWWKALQLAVYLLCEPEYTERAVVILREDGDYWIDDSMNNVTDWRADRDTVIRAAGLIQERLKHGDRNIFTDTGRILTHGYRTDDSPFDDPGPVQDIRRDRDGVGREGGRPPQAG